MSVTIAYAILTHSISIRTSGLRYQRCMDGDVIRHRPYLLQSELPDAELGGGLGLQYGIEGDDVHAEGLHSVGHLATDTAHTEDREGLAGQLVAGVQFPVPSTFLQRLRGLRDIACQRGDQGARQLASADAVAARRAVIIKANDVIT